MSMPTAILTADPDDFRRWQAELDMSALEPLDGPRIPAQRTRAAEKADAADEIAEGYLAWLHGREA